MVEPTILEQQIQEYVNKFIDDFKLRYDIKPVVLYTLKDYRKKGTHLSARLKPVPFNVVEEVANKMLKENLDASNMPFLPITSRKRKRDIINYKHAVCKILYDMGYTVLKIGQCLNINHSTVSVAIAKVEGFLSIGDPVFTDIVKTLQHEIENKTRDTDSI